MKTFLNWLESLQVSQYLSTLKNAERINDWLLSNPEVQKFLAEIDRFNLVPPKVNEKGFLVMSRGVSNPFGYNQPDEEHTGNAYQHRIPVVIVKLNGNQAEIARTDGKNFEELTYKVPYFPTPKDKKTIVVPLDRISIVKQDQRKTYLSWLAYAVKKGANDAGISIPKYFAANWEKIKQTLTNSLSNQQMQSKFRTTGLNFNDFMTEFPDVNKKYRGGTGAQARTIINFPNGFKWVSLDKAACQVEGDAGGHCGNTADPKEGENILSLRDANNRVYLTFVIDAAGQLIERKANGNKKPSEDLHPYIIELLKNPIVKGLGPGKYLAGQDFQIYDLNAENLAKLHKNRPDLVSHINKIDTLFIKNKNKERKVINFLNEKFPKLKELNVTGYDPEQNSLIIDEGESIAHSNKRTVWKDQIEKLLTNSMGNPWFDKLQFLNDVIHDLPVTAITSILDYFRKGNLKINTPIPGNAKDALSQNLHDFVGIFEIYSKRDKNFKHLIDLSLQEAHTKSVLDSINRDLIEQELDDGIHYKINMINGFPYLYKMLKTKYIKKFNNLSESEPDSLHISNNIEIGVDYFVEAINKNLRLLQYPKY